MLNFNKSERIAVTVQLMSLYVLLTYFSIPLKDEKELQYAEKERNESCKQIHLEGR